jgi:hypothetical protein
MLEERCQAEGMSHGLCSITTAAGRMTSEFLTRGLRSRAGPLPRASWRDRAASQILASRFPCSAGQTFYHVVHAIAERGANGA